jgi:hypothetical protein
MLQAAVSNLPPIVAIPSHSKPAKSHCGESILHKDVKVKVDPTISMKIKADGQNVSP